MEPAIFVPIFSYKTYLEENKMSGCGCSFSAVEEVKEEVKYTDAACRTVCKRGWSRSKTK